MTDTIFLQSTDLRSRALRSDLNSPKVRNFAKCPVSMLIGFPVDYGDCFLTDFSASVTIIT